MELLGEKSRLPEWAGVLTYRHDGFKCQSPRGYVDTKSISHHIQWIRLVHLTICWPSSSALIVALTVVDLIAPKSYLCKPTVIAHGHLGYLLLSITFPCRERKLIARLVNYLLTYEFMQLKPYSLGEACLKVGLFR
jgi:hypothetical protein